MRHTSEERSELIQRLNISYARVPAHDLHFTLRQLDSVDNSLRIPISFASCLDGNLPVRQRQTAGSPTTPYARTVFPTDPATAGTEYSPRVRTLYRCGGSPVDGDQFHAIRL